MYNPKEYIGNNYDGEFIRFLFDLTFANEVKVPNKRVEKNLEKFHKEMELISSNLKKLREYHRLPPLLDIKEKYGEGFKSEIDISEKGINSTLLSLYSKALDCLLLDGLYLEVKDMMNEDVTGGLVTIKTEKIEIGDFIPFKLGHESQNENYLIEIIYKTNKERAYKYIQEYLKLWGNNSLTSNENNYLLCNQQIAFIQKIIEVAEERYGGENITIHYGEGKFKENKEIDFFMCFLYLDSINQIKIKTHHSAQKKITFDVITQESDSSNIISELGYETLKLHNGFNYDITPGEYNLLKHFYKKENRKRNLLDDESISTSHDGLNKIIMRLQGKISNKIKIKKVRGKPLWYIEKS